MYSLLCKVAIVLMCFIAINRVSFCQSEYVISQDDQNRITTKVSSGSKVLVTLEGSPFYTNPPWQPGSLTEGNLKREMVGEIAYDVVTNKVSFRSTTGQQAAVTPQEFQINGVRFISETKHTLENVTRRYYEVLYAGKIKFLRYISRKVFMFSIRSSNSAYDGYYRQKDTYFINRGNNHFIPVKLTKASLIDVLGDQIKQPLVPMPTDKLTTFDIVNLLKENQLE